MIFIKKYVSQVNKFKVCVSSNDMEKIKYELSSSNIKVSFVNQVSYFYVFYCVIFFENEKKYNENVQNVKKFYI